MIMPLVVELLAIFVTKASHDLAGTGFAFAQGMMRSAQPSSE